VVDRPVSFSEVTRATHSTYADFLRSYGWLEWYSIVVSSYLRNDRIQQIECRHAVEQRRATSVQPIDAGAEDHITLAVAYGLLSVTGRIDRR